MLNGQLTPDIATHIVPGAEMHVLSAVTKIWRRINHPDSKCCVWFEFHASYWGHSWLAILYMRGDYNNKEQGLAVSRSPPTCLQSSSVDSDEWWHKSVSRVRNGHWLRRNAMCWTVVRPERYSKSTKQKSNFVSPCFEKTSGRFNMLPRYSWYKGLDPQGKILLARG